MRIEVFGCQPVTLSVVLDS